jgi:Ca2+/Na+ antiporter
MFFTGASKRSGQKKAVSGVLGGLLLFITIIAGTGVLLAKIELRYLELFKDEAQWKRV